MGYNGDYLEELIKEGNATMISKIISKGTQVDRKLLNDGEVHQLGESVDEALVHLKKINRFRYRAAERNMTMPTTKAKLDLFLAIDDILINNKTDQWIGIDWTTNKNSQDLFKKINNHKDLKECHWVVGLDKTIVVLVINEGAIPDGKEAKFVYRALKAINKEVNKKDFQGGMTIDAREILK